MLDGTKLMRLSRGESLDNLSREVGLEISRLERCRDKTMRGLEEGLRERKGIHTGRLWTR